MTVQLHSLSELNEFLHSRAYSSFTILTDSNTHEHCLGDLLASCEAFKDAEVIEVEPGESSKDVEIASGIWSVLLENGTDRHACLINLGGGMVTDLGGFVATTFKRGIAFIHIPTSLLGMVDAAIGGKTGINLDSHKNQVGTFAPPHAVVTCAEWLQTLPDRELRSGYAEMLKHGLVADPAHFNELANLTSLHIEELAPSIRRSAELKMQVVEQDFREAGLRQILNFGHTAGHALEALMAQNGTPILHGEAVAQGLRCALQLSVSELGLDQGVADTASAALQRFVPLPTGRMTPATAELLWPFMLTDKKNREGQVRFVLLEALGKPQMDQPVDFTTFAQAWQSIVD